MLRGGLAEVKDYPLSDGDIRKILGADIKIIPYPELQNKRSIDECFDGKGRCIVLFLTQSPVEGHWCCLLNKKKGIEFFDPYGDSPDGVIDEIPAQRREALDMERPYLARLLKQSGRPVFYNSYPFQKDKANVNTCGRHCVVRCLYAPFSLEKYKQTIDASGMSPDNFVSALTASALGK
jgi:hypothetical protein